MSCDKALSYRSVSGKQVVEMYQCKESCTERKEKNHLGQNVKVRTCDYRMDWEPHWVNHQDFHQNMDRVASGCPGFELARGNPAFPDNLQPGTTTDFAQTVLTAGTERRQLGEEGALEAAAVVGARLRRRLQTGPAPQRPGAQAAPAPQLAGPGASAAGYTLNHYLVSQL